MRSIRNFTRSSITPVPLGGPVHLRFSLLPVSYLFAAGHRIRLTLRLEDVDLFRESCACRNHSGHGASPHTGSDTSDFTPPAAGARGEESSGSVEVRSDGSWQAVGAAEEEQERGIDAAPTADHAQGSQCKPSTAGVLRGAHNSGTLHAYQQHKDVLYVPRLELPVVLPPERFDSKE